MNCSTTTHSPELSVYPPPPCHSLSYLSSSCRTPVLQLPVQNELYTHTRKGKQAAKLQLQLEKKRIYIILSRHKQRVSVMEPRPLAKGLLHLLRPSWDRVAPTASQREQFSRSALPCTISSRHRNRIIFYTFLLISHSRIRAVEGAGGQVLRQVSDSSIANCNFGISWKKKQIREGRKKMEKLNPFLISLSQI